MERHLFFVDTGRQGLFDMNMWILNDSNYTIHVHVDSESLMVNFHNLLQISLKKS